MRKVKVEFNVFSKRLCRYSELNLYLYFVNKYDQMVVKLLRNRKINAENVRIFKFIMLVVAFFQELKIK